MKVYTFAYFRKYILIIAKMKNLNFSFIDIFSSSKEKKKRLRFRCHYIIIFHESTASLAGRLGHETTDVARSNQFLPPSPPSKPFKRLTTKVIKSSHYLGLDRN